MCLDGYSGVSGYKSVPLKCDECGQDYVGKLNTARKQIEEIGLHQCRSCSSRRAGKKTAAKMSHIYSVLYSGDGNPAKKPGVGKKISEAKKGIPLTEEQKRKLCKPKSKTDKIKEAANRPEERARRSKLMAERMIANDVRLKAKVSYVTIDKSPTPLLCRSKLEEKFIKKADWCSKIKAIASAERLCLPYYKDGVLLHYLPDFRIDLVDNSVYIVEIKGEYFKNEEEVLLKMKTLQVFCNLNNFSCVLLSERDIHKWLEQFK
jgi:hypothetical protein